MERRTSLLLLLGRFCYEKLPEEVVKKVEKMVEDANSKIAESSNLNNVLRKSVEKLRRDLHIKNVESLNAKEMLKASESNVNELRQQLNTANEEIDRLTVRVKEEESENEKHREKRNELVDENNRLKKISGEKDLEINRLKSEFECLQRKYELVVSEKNVAVSRFAESTEKQLSMENKEKRVEMEIERLKKENAELTDKYNQTSLELTESKQSSASAASQMEIDLRDRMEELCDAKFTIRQLTESNQLLTKQRGGETVQIDNSFNESVTLTEHYKRELDANIKLVELYKANSNECQTEKSKLEKILTEIAKKLTEKESTIERLKGDLEAAKTEHFEKLLERKFPRAATSNRMLKDNLSLTEIFSRYYDSLNDIHRLEMDCMHSTAKVECLTVKLQDTTSEFERQQIEYRNILKLNEELTQQMDVVVAERESFLEKLNETSLKLTNVESENVQLKCTQKDLARQICNLLNKVETNGGGLTSDQQQLKRLGLSNESIRKELVTFDNIVELQENNQKLMLKVRELSSKVEKQKIGMESCEQKISHLEKLLSNGEHARQTSELLLATTSKQKERFKQLYYDAMDYMGTEILTEDVAENTAGSDNEVLRSVQREKSKELRILQEVYDEYRKQATINLDIQKEQYDTMERKVCELQSMNSQLQSQENFTKERIKTFQNEIDICKKQIQILEERNQIYDKAIAKHEFASKQLREEAWNTIIQLSTAENRCAYLELECRRLLEAKKNLEVENNAFHRQNMTKSILESSCELAKISSERSNFEGRVQIQKQLEDHMRKCRDESRKLKEELDRLHAENDSLKREKMNSLNKLMDEQTQTDVLRTKLSEAREQVEAKSVQIKNLSGKLQVALTSKSTYCVSGKSRTFKDLEVAVNSKTAEIVRLNMVLQEYETKIQSFAKQKSDWDAEMNALKSNLEACRLSESNSKSHIRELQQEIRIQSLNKSNPEAEKEFRAEHKKTLEKIAQNNEELRELRTQCQKLNETLQVVQKNYAEKMLEHSSDLEILTSSKAELSNCREKMQQFKMAKDETDELLSAKQLEWEATNKKFEEDRKEWEKKVEHLEKQTMELVDLMQTQNRQLSTSNSESLDVSSSIMYPTLTDDRLKELSCEKLFDVVKFLKREKNIAVTQTKILNIENTRLSDELKVQKKRVNELSMHSKSTESVIPSVNGSSNLVSADENEELRSAINTLNALTDSNIYLRAEKEDLENKAKNLADQVTRLEAKLSLMQVYISELREKLNEQTNENSMLRLNVDQLRKDEYSLENECENLTKEELNLIDEPAPSSETQPLPEQLINNNVSSLETVSPAKVSPQTSNYKRLRENDTIDLTDPFVAENVFPQTKQKRLRRDHSSSQRASENVGFMTNGGEESETTDGESATTVAEDMISEVESIDSGRVSSELTGTLRSDKLQFEKESGRRHANPDNSKEVDVAAAPARRGRIRMKK